MSHANLIALKSKDSIMIKKQKDTYVLCGCPKVLKLDKNLY